MNPTLDDLLQSQEKPPRTKIYQVTPNLRLEMVFFTATLSYMISVTRSFRHAPRVTANQRMTLIPAATLTVNTLDWKNQQAS